MKNLIKISLFLIFGICSAHDIYAKQKPFVIISSKKDVIQKGFLKPIETAPMPGILTSKNALIISDSNASLIVTTGPEEDMLSYLIHGLRNPKLVFRSGSKLRILFINTDGDMQHDIRFSESKPPFPVSIPTTESIGTSRRDHELNGKLSTEEITIRAPEAGKYSYYCSVRGHAKGGMWGQIVVVESNTSTEEMIRIGADTSADQTQEMHGVNDNMENMDNSQMTGMDMGNMQMNKSDTVKSKVGGMDMNMMDKDKMDMGTMAMGKMNGLLLTEPMSKEGSGTSWLPESSPMYMWMTHSSDWLLMLHGTIMPRYDHQGGPRGGNKFDAPNMFMGMLEHGVGSDGQFTAHLMMSLDPLTEAPKGYPLLLQTGESYQGVKLVDIQHPHDLVDELSVAYSQRLSEKTFAFIYLGYPGEPALGPTVFMHRPSAMSNPNAPLSHHWMDATHVTFGVATAGIAIGNWKLEGSYFNGSEPDENRYDFDKLKFNSYSGRLSFNPTTDLALQVSSGLLRNPEGDEIDVIRSTASAVYTKNYGGGNWWSTTASWGENHEVSQLTLEAFLIESQYNWQSWSAYGRAEYVQKTNSELNISTNPDQINNVSSVTVGLTRKLFDIMSFDVDLGAQGSFYFVPSTLVPLYSEHPASYEIYLSIHPTIM